MINPSWTLTNNNPNHPHFMPNKKWNAYKKWEDKGYVFFDRIAKAFDPMIFRPNYSGHSIVSVTTHFIR